MPTYDYECEGCGHSFELFQKMTDDVVDKCPECKGAVRRLIGTGAGIIFKGGGFYQTDYKNNSSSSSEKPGESADKKAPPCAEAKDCSSCKHNE